MDLPSTADSTLAVTNAAALSETVVAGVADTAIAADDYSNIAALSSVIVDCWYSYIGVSCNRLC